MAAVTTGNIADRPFGRTVAAIAQRRFTGDLRLTAQGQVWAIGWQDGHVVAAEGSHPADSAIKTAMNAGLITSTQAAAVLRSVSAGVDDVALVGELTRLGPDNLARLRRRVVANRAMRLFSFDAGDFVLDDVRALPAPAEMVPIDPRVIIFQGVRAHFTDERLQRELTTLGDQFRLRDGAAEAFAAFGLGDAEQPALDVLTQRAITWAELIQAAPYVEPHVAHSALYALAVCGYVDIGSGRGHRSSIPPATGTTAPAAPRPESATQPPPASKTPSGRQRRLSVPAKTGPGATIEQIRDLVRERLAKLAAGADHFGLLGVAADASPDTVRSAYFEVARQLHPDRITATGLEDIRTDAQRLFAQINTAFAVLSNPKRRADYVQTLRAGGEAVVRRKEEEAELLAARLLSGEDHFRAGEMALRRNQLEVAIGEFTKAVELNPEECEHHALLAWTTWCAAPDKAAAAKVARDALERSSKMSPKNSVPHMLLGKMARQLGDDQAAARHFREVLEVSPQHGEATSELRLVESRLASKPAKPDKADGGGGDKKPGGLFSRFKR